MTTSPTDTFVVDGSVVAKWTLSEEEHGDRALRLSDRFITARIQLAAPEYLELEVAAAVNGASRGRRQRLPPGEAQRAIEDFRMLPIELAPTAPLLVPAHLLTLRYNCAFYGALYLALAQRLNTTLVTADRRFYAAVQRLPEVVWIGDYE